MEILILATTLMSLEDILLNEISHKMTNTVQFSPCVIPGGVKFTNRKVEQRFPGAGGSGEEWGVIVSWYRVSAWNDFFYI